MTQPIVYLDHAATTPMLPVAVEAMTRQLAGVGNASSLHASGRGARRVVEESRETIAGVIGASSRRRRLHLRWHRVRQPRAQGHLLGPPRRGPASVAHPLDRDRAPRRPRPAALARPRTTAPTSSCCRSTPQGVLDLESLRDSIARDPGSVGPGLGDVGQQRGRLAAAARRGRGPRRASTRSPCTPTPSRRSAQVPVDFAASGVDALTFTGHKVGGPYGVGALVVRRDLPVSALVHGGGQERDIRSGTLDVPAIAGLAAAVEASVKAQHEHACGRRAARRPGAPGHRGRPRRPPPRCPDGPRPAARQRPHRLPRLRGRLAADAARRPRHRVLHRLGLLRRRAPALPRPARDGLRRRPGPPLAALLARPHHHRPPTSTPSSRRSAPSSSARGPPGRADGGA